LESLEDEGYWIPTKNTEAISSSEMIGLNESASTGDIDKGLVEKENEGDALVFRFSVRNLSYKDRCRDLEL
jgi:hypothetical protein